MNSSSRSRLELYIEKSNILQSSMFYKQLAENGLNLSLHWQPGSGVEISHDAPEGEALQALALTFRMFIQDNDKLSFHNMATLLDDPGISQNWKDQFSDVRSVVNKSLDSSGDIKINVNGTDFPVRLVLDTFLYGELAHTNETHRARYREWRSNPFVFPYVQNIFTSAVMTICSAVTYIAEMSRRELGGDTVPPLPGGQSTPGTS